MEGSNMSNYDNQENRNNQSYRSADNRNNHNNRNRNNNHQKRNDNYQKRNDNYKKRDNYNNQNRNNYDNRENQNNNKPYDPNAEVKMLASGAAIVGAGILATQGLSAASKYKKAAGQKAMGGFMRYFQKNKNPYIRNATNIGQQTFRKINPKNKVTEKKVVDESVRRAQEFMKQPAEKQIEQLAAQRIADMDATNRLRKLRAKQTGEKPDFVKYNVNDVYDQAKNDVFHKNIDFGNVKKDLDNKNRGPKNNGPRSQGSIIFENVRDSAIGGTAFAGAITTFHGVERALENKNEARKNREKREQTFSSLGSMLPTTKELEDWKKEASYKRIYDKAATFGKAIPDAAAKGIGYTGVSLATVGLMNKKNKEKEQEKTKNRIIIELDDHSPDEKNPTAVGARKNLPNVDQLSKAASFKGLATGFKQTMKNLGGRGAEIDKMKKDMERRNYTAAAAKKMDNAKNPYTGKLSDEESRSQYLKDIATKIKHSDEDKIRGVQESVAKARTLAGGAALGTGGVALGASKLRNKKGDEQNG